MVLEKKDFDSYLNEEFMVRLPDEEDLPLELVEISEMNTKQTICFSLLFRGAKERVLPQGNFTFEHGNMGQRDLFLVPVMVAKADGIYYEVVFNRLRE